jgi:glycosyltransferase involved in cell wall biosynthesis
MPTVTVVMPTHNRARLLRRAIRSVLAQTYRDFDLVVVDDASTDDTPDVVAAFTDPRLRYIRLPQNRRAAAARNVGIASSSSRYVAFHDDDDQWLLPKLERQVAALAAAPDDVGLCLCGHVRISPTGAAYLGGPDWQQKLDFRRGMSSSFALIATPGWLVRRSILERHGVFDERIRSWDDWELGLRLWRNTRFMLVDEPLFVQDRLEGGGMWRNEAVHATDMKVILERHEPVWADRPKVLSYHYFIVGRIECTHGNPAEGRRWLRRAIRLDPSNARAWLAWLSSLLGRRAIVAATVALRRAKALLKRLLQQR